MRSHASLFLFVLYLVSPAVSHFSAWHIGMYCLNGTQPGFVDLSHGYPANPLFQLPFKEWWFHHVDKCDEFPPAEGDFLELPANGQFTVEIANNRVFTTLSYGGRNVAAFGDGQGHPGLGDPQPDGSTPCITDPNIHTQNESMAAGTAFAISYNSDISQVTPDNLVVFTVLYNTPWKRIATYDVPNLPVCPEGGCICAWGWVPNGCGEPNIYHQGFKCKVTGNTGSASLAIPKAAVWCEDNPANCVTGAKQMIYWHQAEGNNIETRDGEVDLAGQARSPGYNAKCGFNNGAQHDIFLEEGTAERTSVQGTTTQTVPPFAPSATNENINGAASLIHSPGVVWLIAIALVAIELSLLDFLFSP